jgi:16S rRNA (uracil1498-N3)-methyltransferase
MEPGDELELFDGQGRSARASVDVIAGQTVHLALTAPPVLEPPPLPILLGSAIPKGQLIEDIIRQATEIGATRIVPLLTERCIVKVDDPSRRQEKWQRVALEACKQCGRNWIPAVDSPVRLEAFLTRNLDRSELRCVAALCEHAESLERCWPHEKPPESISVLTGPEGDFTSNELSLLIQGGYAPLWLGPHILRADTAAAYAMSIISQRFLR